MCLFDHLHTHTEFDLFDGDCKLEQIYNKAKRSKMNSIGLTGHHNVFAWFPASHLSKQYRIKPIFGMEVNVGKHHLTALSMNQEGIKNIVRLNNLGQLKKGRTVISEKELFEHSNGVILLSGCSRGKVPTLLAENQFKTLLQTLNEYNETFPDRFFLEVQNYNTKSSVSMIKMMNTLAKRMKMTLIPTNDCHFADKEDAAFHHRLVSMNSNGKISLHNKENYFKTPEEMLEVFPKEVLQLTQLVTQQCNADFDYYIQEQHGDMEVPIGMVYRYDDAEALRKALYARKEFKLGEFMYKKMKKEGMKLEDLYDNGTLKDDIPFAYGLRDKIYKIEPDPYYYIRTTSDFPMYQKNKEVEACAQMDIFTAYELGFEVYDRRKTAIFMTT